jgi:flagellar hook-associated protein 3 FlgL
MQVSTRQYFKAQNENMADLKTDISKLQQQISTGKILEIPSDNPVAFSDGARLKHQLAKVDQYNRNMTNLLQRIEAEESTLSDATNILTRITELSLQGANDTLSAKDRKIVAGEIEQLRESLIQLANVKDNSELAIFGGYKGNIKPFSQDEDGNVIFVGDTNVQNVEIADGIETKANGNGFEIFMQVRVAGAKRVSSVFQLVSDVTNKLNSGLSCSGEVAGVRAALEQVNIAQMIAGTRIAKISRQQESLAAVQLQAKTMLSAIEDTDIEKAVSELKQKMLSLDASQASFVKIADLSLFNYLR